MSSVYRHLVGSELLQKEAMANGTADFSSSPSIPDVVDEFIYTAGIGHQKAVNILIDTASTTGTVEVFLRAGLHQALRECAEQEAAEVG